MAAVGSLLRTIGTAFIVAAVLVAVIGILLGAVAIAGAEASNGLQVMAAAVLLAVLLGTGGWYLRRRYSSLP